MIKSSFGELLKEVGVSPDETCVLSHYNKEEFSFNCHLTNVGTDIKIALRYGNFIDFSPEITITKEDMQVCYEYFNSLNPKLYLERKACQNNQNKNTYYRNYYLYLADYKVTNRSFSLNIKVRRPKSVNISAPNVFVLENEEALESYLISLPRTYSLMNVFDALYEICFKEKKVEKLNELELSIKKGFSLENGESHDELTLKDGELIHSNNGLKVTQKISDYCNTRKLKNAEQNQG